MGNTVQNLVPYVLRATVPPGVTGIANGLMSNVSKKQSKVSFTYFTMAEMTGHWISLCVKCCRVVDSVPIRHTISIL